MWGRMNERADIGSGVERGDGEGEGGGGVGWERMEEGRRGERRSGVGGEVDKDERDHQRWGGTGEGGGDEGRCGRCVGYPIVAVRIFFGRA